MFVKRIGCLIIIVLLCVHIGAQHKGSSFLPEPTGSYSIGTKSYEITYPADTKRSSREDKVFVKIWYPSDSVVDVSHHKKYLEGYNLDEIYNNFKTKGITKEEIEDISNYYTNTTENLPISLKQKNFPVILFTPGYYFGLSDIYSSFTENLASNGFIVCSITHQHQQINVEGKEGEDNSLQKAKSALPFLQWWWVRQRSLSDFEKPKNQERLTKYYLRNLRRFDRVIRKWEASSMYCVDYFRDRVSQDPVFAKMDFERVGAFGQSIGGALSNHLCVKHKIIKAGVSMDCFQFGDVISCEPEKPLMLIESDHQYSWQIGNEYIYRNYKELEYLRIKGALHFLFCDVPYYDVVTSDEKIEGFIGETQGKIAVEKINQSVLSFFNRHLNHTKCNTDELFVHNNLFIHQINNQCIFLK